MKRQKISSAKKQFREWVKKRSDDTVDVGAMADWYDPELTLSENKEEFLERFPYFRTEKEMAQTSLDMFIQHAVEELKNAGEKTLRKIMKELGYSLKKEKSINPIVWEKYGTRSYYSLEEAEKIAKELQEQGYEVYVSKILIKHPGPSLINCPLEANYPYYECEVRYKRNIFEDKPKASIE